MIILSVVAARPNFMKIAPFIRAIEKHNALSRNPHIKHILVHTGQHYDDSMSKLFFEELNIPEADINLGVGSGTHAEQVGNTMIAFEKVLKTEKPDWVIVLGDVNATLACSVTAKKEGIMCCHIEAGLRSGDTLMPEEINRLVTDRLSDLLLTPDNFSSQNLRNEGTPGERIRLVGNIMIDTLETNLERASNLIIEDIIGKNISQLNNSKYNVPFDGNYVLITLHRPSNVDKKEVLGPLIDFIIEEVVSHTCLIWPIHPRTLKRLKEFDLLNQLIEYKSIILLEPLGYIEMLRLNMSARVVFTDSGGLQEECTVLGTPCLTLRWNTERPITLKANGGVSVLVGNDTNLLKEQFKIALNQSRISVRPLLWDGKTAERCLNEIINFNK